MKILPIYPKIPISFWGYRYSLELIGKSASMPPLGLATVLALLPKKGFEIMPIVDLNVRDVTDKELNEADLIFTSSMIVQKESLNEIIDRAHSMGKKVVAGGPYPTSYKEDVAADYLILGEAEITLPFFINDLLNGKPKRIYEENNKKPSLSKTPLPRWDLVDMDKYSSMAIQFSRGCPFNCEFCDITKLFGRESRTKSANQMIEELDALRKFGWRGSVFIVDDNFIGNKNNVRELLPKLIEWQKKHDYVFSLFTEASMDLAMPQYNDILKNMVEAGFEMVFVGVESHDTEVLKKMRKGQNFGISSPLEKIKIIQKAGLEVTGGFIVGSDGEKKEVFENLFNFIQKSGIVVPMVGLITALKGTDLYNRLNKEGRLREESIGTSAYAMNFNFKTELDEEFLIKGYAKLLKKLFSSKNYYTRCKTFNNRRGPYHPQKLADKNGIKAFFRISYENLLQKPDIHFLRFVLKTSLKEPSKFPLAISRAVKLRHFKKMTQGTLAVRGYKEKIGKMYIRFCKKIERLKGYSNKEIQAFIREVERIEKKTIKKAHRQYIKIPVDFRKDAKPTLMKLKEMIEGYRRQILYGVAGIRTQV